ncbi:phosphate/phosphite/phosphonate ABC transporter substrate-binding protein [Hoeflea ulvae]|uniref:PhnD/SsuA/transferrin family substrate-binding protein n=1 Tax=Hoeflea ulvae TaxID=2983764 RepID=A0ABT3YLQ7_9HYPH|nr:PhnD/SsuA/transferrin family substrate-binding protein [Hoeflea ulvae]MCY0096527.1 PhnD/SsuA/transferrin family substrate-binding protein [Hoeflea ulvae]
MSGAASLPMYDWPEIRDATDTLWTAIREQLLQRGIDAPVQLQRPADPEPLWTAPDLLLSQTCGYPYANRLRGRVMLLGTPAHAVTGARPGHYFSVLIAHRDRLPEHAGDLADRRLAFNMTHSQSGFAAPVRLLAAGGHASWPEPLETGSHRGSIKAVADGSADWASIDAVTWELAMRHEPAAADLAVFATTPQTPALPLIAGAAFAGQSDAIAGAVEAAIKGLDAGIRDAVLITGLARFKPEDYAPLAAPLPVDKALPTLPR